MTMTTTTTTMGGGEEGGDDDDDVDDDGSFVLCSFGCSFRDVHSSAVHLVLGSLGKPQWQLQTNTMAVLVGYNSCYISLPFSIKQHARGMNTF